MRRAEVVMSDSKAYDDNGDGNGCGRDHDGARNASSVLEEEEEEEEARRQLLHGCRLAAKLEARLQLRSTGGLSGCETNLADGGSILALAAAATEIISAFNTAIRSMLLCGAPPSISMITNERDSGKIPAGTIPTGGDSSEILAIAVPSGRDSGKIPVAVIPFGRDSGEIPAIAIPNARDSSKIPAWREDSGKIRTVAIRGGRDSGTIPARQDYSGAKIPTIATAKRREDSGTILARREDSHEIPAIAVPNARDSGNKILATTASSYNEAGSSFQREARGIAEATMEMDRSGISSLKIKKVMAMGPMRIGRGHPNEIDGGDDDDDVADDEDDENGSNPWARGYSPSMSGCGGNMSGRPSPKTRKLGPRITLLMPACNDTPDMGGSDGQQQQQPMDDGHTWRKYGRKAIQGAHYHRSYYRCTHKKDKGCGAIRQVQRCDEKPALFQVTYKGYHECHPSAKVYWPFAFPWSGSQMAARTSHRIHTSPAPSCIDGNNGNEHGHGGYSSSADLWSQALPDLPGTEQQQEPLLGIVDGSFFAPELSVVISRATAQQHELSPDAAILAWPPEECAIYSASIISDPSPAASYAGGHLIGAPLNILPSEQQQQQSSSSRQLHQDLMLSVFDDMGHHAGEEEDQGSR